VIPKNNFMIKVQDAPTNQDPFVPKGSPNELPSGEVFKADPDTWYNLVVHYTDQNGQPADGYLGPVGYNAATSYWDYMQVSGDASKFKLHPRADGWADWEIDDGNYLSLKLTGWAYRASDSDYRIGWQIVDGKLYNAYWSSDWNSYPAGCEYNTFLVSTAYYVGVKLENAFTCELVPAK
jgi:hypothetical protein